MPIEEFILRYGIDLGQKILDELPYDYTHYDVVRGKYIQRFIVLGFPQVSATQAISELNKPVSQSKDEDLINIKQLRSYLMMENNNVKV